jgi:hypothetical protein
VASLGTIPLADIWAMLDHCAKGYTKQRKKHHWWVYFNDKSFRSLPLGKHGKGTHVSIEVGHVRQMVRLFGIEECAASVIQLLR